MKTIGLILISVALVATFRPDIVRFIFPNENDVVENDRDAAPTRTLREITAPIRDVALSREDALRLGSFYRALADVIDRDEEGVIKTSGEVRLINERSGRLCFGKTGIAGRYPRLAEEIDVVIAHGVGSKRVDGKWESVEIGRENRKSLAEALKAVAWACDQ